jgi:hypothetical protein
MLQKTAMLSAMRQRELALALRTVEEWVLCVSGAVILAGKIRRESDWLEEVWCGLFATEGDRPLVPAPLSVVMYALQQSRQGDIEPVRQVSRMAFLIMEARNALSDPVERNSREFLLFMSSAVAGDLDCFALLVDRHRRFAREGESAWRSAMKVAAAAVRFGRKSFLLGAEGLLANDAVWLEEFRAGEIAEALEIKDTETLSRLLPYCESESIRERVISAGLSAAGLDTVLAFGPVSQAAADRAVSCATELHNLAACKRLLEIPSVSPSFVLSEAAKNSFTTGLEWILQSGLVTSASYDERRFGSVMDRALPARSIAVIHLLARHGFAPKSNATANLWLRAQFGSAC